MGEERKDKLEAVILVRIDNMVTFATEGQRSIRFEIDGDGDDQSINELVTEALSKAPPINEWQGF